MARPSMPALRGRRRPPTRLVAAGTAVAVLAAGAVYAASRPGESTEYVQPDGGTVWVTNDRAGLFGRLNGPAAQLDAAAPPGGEAAQTFQLDVVEADGTVFARDRLAGRITPVDVETGRLLTDDAVPLEPTARLATGGGTTLAVDPDTGAVRAGIPDPDGAAGATGLSSDGEPLETVQVAATDSGGGTSADVAVGSDGVGYAAGSGGDLVTVTPVDGRVQAVRSSFGGGFQDVRLVVTQDGPVVLDTVAGAIARPDSGERTALDRPLADAAVQRQPVQHAVLVATPSDLVSVDTRTGRVTPLASGGSGTPAPPVRVDDCAYAVWAGSPGRAVRVCDGGDAETVDLENADTLLSPSLRVDRRTGVLNDAATGGVWDLRTGRRLDNWDAVAPPTKATTPDEPDEPDTTGRSSTPPVAQDDALGARPGRTSILHVLDNDSNPSGSVLSITSVSEVRPGGATVAVSPDGQTVQLTMSPSAGTVSFRYTIDDGKGATSSATVAVTARGPDQNGAPVLRETYRASPTTVANRGVVSVPVIGDWRDPDSDPVALTSATDGETPVTVTNDGRVRYAAPGEAGPRTLGYVVSDGRSTATGTVPVTVLGRGSTETRPARPLSDVGRGETGQPVVVRPLENDLPGTDPLNPGARLEIATDVLAPEGATVETSRETGAVTVTAGAAGTYLLSYTVKYGDAPYARGTIRIDVVDPEKRRQGLTAMLDQAVVHGRNATIVDVLANDLDPSGRLIVVQSARAEASEVLEVAVLRGRWLRIAATRDEISPNPMRIQYTITNGSGDTATGDVSVIQLPEPEDRTPVPVDDSATVRSGDTVTVAALDNDTDPSGEPLTLVTRVEDAPRVGTLPVSGPSGTTSTDAGAAYVSGSVVRFQAPVVTAATTSTVDYTVENASGDRASGKIVVRVEPPPSPDRPDRAPLPSTLEGRVVAGDSITIAIPASGSDPDGDSVTLSGLGSLPRLGRILEQGPSSVTYQAYPTSGGTDEFTYVVSDRFGKTGTGTVRVAVAPPGDPQPVVAVDDQVTVAPGAVVSVSVLGNDIQPIGENATVSPLGPLNPDLGDAATLDEETGVIVVQGPAPDAPFDVRYEIVGANGVPSRATLRVRGRDGTNLPPVPRNAIALPDVGATTVTVDVLAGAVDPDDAQGEITVSRVFNAPEATVTGGRVTVPVSDTPQVLAFEIVDAQGAAALGLIHVAVGGSGAPYVKPDSLVRVDRNGSVTVKLSEVVLDPGAKPVVLTTKDRLDSSPAGALTVTAAADDTLTLTAKKGYVGPAAIGFEVTNGADATDPAGRRALLTVPVQIGPETPVLRCPTSAVDVVIGGTSRPFSIPALCHVWTATEGGVDELQFVGSFPGSPPGLSVTSTDRGTLVVSASAQAEPGSTATLQVTAAGTLAEPAELTVRVAPAAPPTVDAVALAGVKAGSTGTVNIDGYLHSPLGNPDWSIVGLDRVGGPGATVRQDGPTTVSVTPDADAAGVITYRVTVTDSPGTTTASRQGSGLLTVEVLGVPDAPPAPTQVGEQRSRAIVLAWGTPADNGLPIEYYTVTWEGGTQRCSASPCRIEDLPNDTPLRFTVLAHNAVGDGRPSAASAAFTADEVPGAPQEPRTSDPRDTRLTLSWDPAPSGGSPVQGYYVSWPGGSAETATTSVEATGLDNSTETTFTIRAENKAGFGPPVTVTGQSAGVPSPPAPTLTPTEVAGGDSVVVRVDWAAVPANGPGSTTYTVVRTGGGESVEVCTTQSATSCVTRPIALDGRTYSFAVRAANRVQTSELGEPATYQAVGSPGDFGNVSARATGTSREVRLSFTAPKARDSALDVTCAIRGGGSCGSWSGLTGRQSIEQTFTVPEDGRAYELTLTATNSAGAGSSAGATTDTVYGPVGDVAVSDVVTVGPYVSFTLSVDPRGLPVDVGYTVEGGIRQSGGDTTGGQAWSARFTEKVGFDANLRISATAARGGDRTSATATTSTGSGAVTVPEDSVVPDDDGTFRIDVAVGNLAPSATITCAIDPQGLGLGQTVTVTLETGGAGNARTAVPPDRFSAESGRRYTISCDDAGGPPTPVRTQWQAP